MKNILTEHNNLHSANIDLMPTLDILQTINNEDNKVAKAVKKALPDIAKAVNLIANAFNQGGRLAYFGAGTSGRLGILDATECMPTFSADKDMVQGYIAGGDTALKTAVEHAEDSTELAIEDINRFSPTKKDVIVGISASGNPNYVLTVLKEAQKRGTKTVGITSNPKANLIKYSDICILTKVGAEVISGSSRMKSGTAQKMVLNMLTTASMIKIGKTYGNYMIDLTPTCDKLILRATKIIAEICEIPLDLASSYLIKADNNTKIACVMYKKQCTKDEAKKLLKSQNGILRKVIENEKEIHA